MECFFFFNDTATTQIYTLSLHDARPISTTGVGWAGSVFWPSHVPPADARGSTTGVTSPLYWSSACQVTVPRSEEHTSELQSRQYLVCRLLLEKKHNRTVHSLLSA